MNNQLHRYQIGRRCGLQAAFASKTSKKPASLLLLSLLYLLSGLPATAQQPQWLNPQPFGSDVNDIEFFDSLRGIAVGSYGDLAFTTDGGINWQKTPSGTNHNLFDIEITGNNTAMAASDTMLIHTTDGGATWSELAVLPGYAFFDLDMVNASAGFALVRADTTELYYQLAKTNDAGYTWNVLPTTWKDDVSAIAFQDEQSGVLVQSTWTVCKVYRTTDSGQNFEITFNSPGKNINDVTFAGDSTFFMCGFTGYDGLVYKSVNGGRNWKTIHPQQNFEVILTGIKAVDSSRVFTWGRVYDFEWNSYPPPVFKTENGGYTWTKNQFPSVFIEKYKQRAGINALGIKNWPSAIASSKSDSYYFNSEIKQLFATHDGLNWAFANNNPFEAIHDIHSSANGTLIASHENIRLTTDDFATYDSIEYLDYGTFTHLAFASQQAGIAFGRVYVGSDNDWELSNVYLTTNGGLNWTPVLDTALVSPLSVWFPVWDKVYMFGKPCHVLWKKAPQASDDISIKVYGKGRFYASHDQGRTWTEHPLPADTLNNMVFTGPLTGCIFGGGGTTPSGGYYRTTDGGLHWEFYPLGTAEVLKGTMVNDTTGFIITRDTLRQVFRFVRSEQGHTLKLLFTAPADEPVNDLAFSDDHQGYLLTLDTDGAATLRQTTDAGDTWQTWGPYAYLRNLKVFYNLNGFAWGDNGRLLQLANGYPVQTPTPAKTGTSLITARAIPGTGQIEATINTTATGQATLTLTDLTGRTLGEWLVTLNGQPQTLRLPTRGLTPGMMVLSLETNGTRAACKVLVNP